MKGKMIVSFLMILSLFITTGCTNNYTGQKNEQSMTTPAPAGLYQKITPEEAHQMMSESSGYILLDVRTQEEYNQTHIDGAVLLPDTDVLAKAGEVLPDKDVVILVYCRSGRRSAQASQQLADMGYTKVYDFGGIIDWPYETVSGTEKE